MGGVEGPGGGGGIKWANIIKKAKSLLLFVDIIYFFTKIVHEGFVPLLKAAAK